MKVKINCKTKPKPKPCPPIVGQFERSLVPWWLLYRMWAPPPALGKMGKRVRCLSQGEFLTSPFLTSVPEPEGRRCLCRLCLLFLAKQAVAEAVGPPRPKANIQSKGTLDCAMPTSSALRCGLIKQNLPLKSLLRQLPRGKHRIPSHQATINRQNSLPVITRAASDAKNITALAMSWRGEIA